MKIVATNKLFEKLKSVELSTVVETKLVFKTNLTNAITKLVPFDVRIVTLKGNENIFILIKAKYPNQIGLIADKNEYNTLMVEVDSDLLSGILY